METNGYYETIQNEDYANYMKDICNFFEPILEQEMMHLIDDFTAIQLELVSLEMKKVVKKMNEYLKKTKRDLIRHYGLHLGRSLTYFIRYDFQKKEIQPGINKWNQLMLSYINFSRILLEDEKIRRSQDHQKIILAVGMIKLEKDNIFVNEEILNMQMQSVFSDDYLLIPLHGCSVREFEKYIKLFQPGYIHLSGHGHQNRISFVDRKIQYRTLQKILTHYSLHYDLLFLNCCFTYEYVKKDPVPFVDYTICFEDALPSDKAFAVSSCFYEALFDQKTVLESWNIAGLKVNSAGYYFLSD